MTSSILFHMIDLGTILKILVIIVFIVIMILQAKGPLINKKAIDHSIAYLKVNVRPPLKEYVPDPELYERFKDNCTDSALLTELATGILQHCGMTPNNLIVMTKNTMENAHTAGTYSTDGIASVITLLVTPSSRHNILHSVLIHECMHYYLFKSGIRFEKTYENEILTDVATVYMGFYQFMYDGYLMVGYLRDSELKYVHRKLTENRDQNT